MATYTFVDLHIPEAQFLADLHGIEWDLRRTREYGEMLLEAMKPENNNWTLVEPLSIAITVSYSRAFSGGVRYRLKDEHLQDLSDTEQEVHSFVRDFRDKHIAHSVNEFEENTVRANYCLDRVQTEGVTGIGCGGGRVAGLSEECIRCLIAITLKLEAKVAQMMQPEKEKLLKVVRSMPLEEVLKMGQKGFNPPMANVSRPRKQRRSAPDN